MKKLRLNLQQMENAEVLTRSQLRNVLGGGGMETTMPGGGGETTAPGGGCDKDNGHCTSDDQCYGTCYRCDLSDNRCYQPPQD